MFVGTMHNSEDTCKTILLHVRESSDDHYCCTTLNKIYAYVRTCTKVRTYTVADNKTYKESMQKRARMAKDRAGSTGQLWHVLQMVQCRPLSEVLLTSVLPRSITVSSLIGGESVEGGAAPDEGSPVCEGNIQGQKKGGMSLHEAHSTGGDHTLQHVNSKTQGKRGGYRMLE